MKRFRVFFLMSILLCCKLVLLSQENEYRNKKISLSLKNATISEAIEKLSDKTNINFSYNSRILANLKVPELKITNIKLDSALKILLEPHNLTYFISSNHIVVYKLHKPLKTTSNTFSGQNKKKEPKVLEKQMVEIRDTVFITDTIVKTDTVFIRDTILKTDTILIETESKPITVIQYDTVFINKPVKKLNSHLIYNLNFSIHERDINKSGIMYGKSKNNMLLGAGIDFSTTTIHSDKEVSDSLVVYLKYIADKYYTVNNGDTAWVFIEDSIQMTHTNTYPQGTGFTIKSFEFPLVYTYAFKLKKAVFYAGITAIPGIIIKTGGNYLANNNTIKKPEQNNNLFYLKAGLIAMYEKSIFENINIFMGSSYTYQLLSYYPDDMKEQNKSQFNIFIGISIKFIKQ